MRFFVLAFFVIVLPAAATDAFGIGDPWFCKYICPTGTLEAGIPLVIADSGLRASVGVVFFIKLGILVLLTVASMMLFRPFCRYLCPLGALYGLFNRFALFRYRFDGEKCVNCGACEKACGLSIPVRQRLNSVDCIRCGDCLSACPTGAIGTVIPFPGKKNGQKSESGETL